MKRLLLTAIAALVLSASQVAFADENVDSCGNDCTEKNTACLAKANNLVNDIEIKDAIAECEASTAACVKACFEAASKPKSE